MPIALCYPLSTVKWAEEATWDSDVLFALCIRFFIHLLVLTLIIYFLYYSKSKRKDYLFTYFLIGTTTFFLCFGLKKMAIDTGMGLGLFAVFGIIRYRTDAIEIKEMTYLFLVIGLSVINSLSFHIISITEIGVTNALILILTFTLENLWPLKHESRKTINYERIDLIVPGKHDEMKADLQNRTGLQINRFEIGKIDFLNDTAQVRVYYFSNEQEFSDYSAQ